MDINGTVIILLPIVLTLILVILGLPIPYSIGFAGLVTMFLEGIGGAALNRLGLIPFSTFYGLNWIALPLFLLMAFIISETGMSKDVFEAANNWVSRLRGGLLVSSLATQAGLAASMGSSTTTMLTMATVAVPEMERLGYKKAFGAATLLAGGVLGPLIPPSIPAIVYAMLAEQSINELFIAGILPGIILLGLLSLVVILLCRQRLEAAPRLAEVSWRDRVYSLRKVWPILALMVGVLGSIMSGIATATEAGAIGVIVSLAVAATRRDFRLINLKRAMLQAATMTGMVGVMVIACNFFSYVVAITGFAEKIVALIQGQGWPPLAVIIIINLIVLALGCIMDAMAIMMVAIPLFIPIVKALGLDLIWFGILMIVNTEIGLITPPIGLNLFVATSACRVSTGELARASVPFIAVLIGFLGLLIAFPQISLYLPNLVRYGVQ
ncbi:MAG: TRAP transporter large permease [Moorellaceae bacterium]